MTSTLYALLVVWWLRDLTNSSTHRAELVYIFSKHVCAALRVTPSCWSVCFVC